MKRALRTLSGLVFTAVIAGCGPGGTNSRPDLSVTPGPSDFSVGMPMDLAVIVGPMGAPTGDPCTKKSECSLGLGLNQQAACLVTTGMAPNQLMWPGGYCTSQCRPSRNSMGTNPDCPGGNGVCIGTGTAGQCYAACNASADCRDATTYGCFSFSEGGACFPRTLSECNPQKRGSCNKMPLPDMTAPPPKDGGAADGGTGPIAYGQTCVNTGDGTVGVCEPGCDPFLNKGCDPNDAKMRVNCYLSDVTAEGLCLQAGMNSGAGMTCGHFFNDCIGGYGCYDPTRSGMGKCFKYCNMNNYKTQCAAGATCAAFVDSAKMPIDPNGAGVCTMSN